MKPGSSCSNLINGREKVVYNYCAVILQVTPFVIAALKYIWPILISSWLSVFCQFFFLITRTKKNQENINVSCKIQNRHEAEQMFTNQG